MWFLSIYLSLLLLFFFSRSGDAVTSLAVMGYGPLIVGFWVAVAKVADLVETATEKDQVAPPSGNWRDDVPF